MPPPPVDGGPVEDVEEEEEDGEDTEEDQVRARKPVRPDHQTVNNSSGMNIPSLFILTGSIFYIYLYIHIFGLFFCLFCEKISS